MRFTDRSIQALQPREKRYEVSETNGRGLWLRISPRGLKTFVYIYRLDGRLRRLTLGTYPELTLAEAHQLHASARAMRKQGKDPAAHRQALLAGHREAPMVAQLAQTYLDRWAKPKKRSWQEDERILKKDILPAWGEMKARDITRGDVLTLLRRIVDRGAPVTANRTHALLSKMFRFGIEQNILDTESSPCALVRPPTKERSRDRVLSEDEIRAFWTGLAETRMSESLKLALKLLLVTAQRRGEIVYAEWSEFDLAAGWWTIPAARSKNGLSHRVPLSSLASSLLSRLHALCGDTPWLLPNPSRSSHMTDRAMSRAVANNRAVFGIAAFTPHDLRRTAASHMTSLGIPPYVVKKVLNHVDTGVTAVYDRHSYDAEKRDALEKWAEKLSVITASVPDNASTVIERP